MTAILTMLATKAGTYIVGAAVIIAAFVATYVKGRLSGAKLERQKQAARDAKAVQDVLDVQNDIGSLTPEQARRRLQEWSKG